MADTIDTSRIEMLLSQLVQLTGHTPNPAGEAVGATDNLPIQRRMVQEAPQYFNNPIANMAYNTFAPMVASHIAGGRETPLMPQFNNAVGAYESFYARDITTPLYDTGKQVMQQHWGAGFGMSLAQMAGNAGMRPKGMSQEEFEGKMADLGASSGGQMLAGALMSTKPMQDIMGGNPMDIYNAIMPRMQQVATPVGALVNPMDTVAQAGMAEHATEFAQSVDKAIYVDPETGKRGFVPNAAFTRGHSMGDIAKTSAYMLDKNTQYAVGTPDGGQEMISMRGMDTSVETKTKMLADQLAVLDTMGQVIQDANIDNKIAALEQFTQGRAQKIDPEVLRGALDNIAATAENLGVSSKSMMNGIMSTQAALSQIGGGSRSATGNYQGGMASGKVAQFVESQVQTIAQQTGRNVDDVRAEQIGLINVAEESSQGKALRMVEYMRQQGSAAVTPELYSELEQQFKTGDTAGREDVLRRIFEGSEYGSAEAVMQRMSDPTFNMEINNRLNPESRLKALQMAQTGQDTELQQRTRETQLGMSERMARRMFVASNQDYDETMNSGKNAKRQLSAMASRLREDGPEGEIMATRLEEQYKRAGGGQKGLSAVRSLINADPELKARKAGLDAIQTEERLKIGAEALDTPEGRKQAELSSKLKYIRTSAMGDQDDKRRRAMDEAETLMRKGDTRGARRIIDTEVGKLSKNERKGLELQLDRDYQRDNSRFQQLKTMGEGDQIGGSAGMVHAETAVGYGISGLGHAVVDRASSAGAFHAVAANAEGGARMRRDMGDIWAAKRETPQQRLVKWAEGRGSVYDVLGVQAPEGSELGDMTPQQVAEMSDKQIGKLSKQDQAAARQMQEYMDSKEGKQALAEVDKAAAMLDAPVASVGSQLTSADQLLSPAAIMGVGGMRPDGPGHGQSERLSDAKEDETGKQLRHGKSGTRLTGTVVLRREGGGVLGTLDFGGAELG